MLYCLPVGRLRPSKKVPRDTVNVRGAFEQHARKFDMTSISTTQRDELLRLHTPLTMDAQKQPEYRDNTESALHGYSEGVEHALDTVWAKGYRKPRTITTVEELDALPWRATILDAEGMGAQWDGEMWSGEGRWWHSAQISLPATVLHEPEAEATR